MFKIFKVIILSLFIIFPFSSHGHVQHYQNLKNIEFDIYRNNKLIGTHIFNFKNENEQLLVKSEIRFQIKKLGVVLYKYHVEGTEIYQNGKLIKFNSNTDQNGKNKFVNMILKNNQYIIDGSSYQGNAPIDYLLGTWWNHSIIEAEAQISAVSGRIIKQNVKFIGKENITINNKTYKTLHFNFTSSDKKLKKDKKLNTHIWYDEETLNWVKASFKKKGNWEYRLISIE